MPDFVISVTGPKGEEHGTLLVDGKQPELFGELVGVNVERKLTLPKTPLDMSIIGPPPTTTVEVTLRLPLGPAEQVTILRDGEIQSVHGPSGDWVATAPDAAQLAAIIRSRVEFAHDALATSESLGFPAEWLADALLAAVTLHKSDLATLRAIADELVIGVDRG